MGGYPSSSAEPGVVVGCFGSITEYIGRRRCSTRRSGMGAIAGSQAAIGASVLFPDGTGRDLLSWAPCAASYTEGDRFTPRHLAGVQQRGGSRRDSSSRRGAFRSRRTAARDDELSA